MLSIHNQKLSMPDLVHLQTFILVSTLGSLAAVARKLGISPAAVSKQLTKLEHDLGVQLLVRTTRRIEFTDIGKSYRLQCQRILEEVEAASELISQVKSAPSGILKVVSGRHFAASYIVPFIKEFLLKYPQIELDLELAERIPDLNLEAIDVLIGMSVSAAGDIIQKRIATTSYTFCASPSYLKRRGIPKKIEELKNHCYITHSMRKPDNELQLCRDENLVLKPYIRVNDTQTMLNFALDGLGIVKLHHYVVKEHLERGELKEILTAYTQSQIPMYVAYPQRRFIAAKVRCFIDFIIKKLKDAG